MDTRTGKLYKDLPEALAAGVPISDARQVRVETIVSGPFKGRRYLLKEDGSKGRRIKPDATLEDIQNLIRNKV